MPSDKISLMDRLVRILPEQKGAWVSSLALATLAVLAAAGIRGLAGTEALPFLFFIPVLMAVGFVLGLGTGLYATILSALAASYFFLPPAFSFRLTTVLWMQVGSYTVVTSGIVAVCAALRRSLSMRDAAIVALAEAQDDLRRLNLDLEQRVVERTSELTQTQAALIQSQKMEAVGQLTSGIAHDFNNLLTGIIGGLELLHIRIGQGRTENVDRYINAAQGAATRAATLTHRLLAFSRQQTLTPEITDVNGLVAGMEELIQRAVGPTITVETITVGELWSTLVDPSQLENALLNLCINARDAMPTGGKLIVETGNKRLDVWAARERDMPEGDYVSLCVSDNGTGMPPEVIARAFDPFFTTKPIGQGTGLGLSMIYGFVRQSGGQVRIHSELGRGSTIRLYLPRHHCIGVTDAAPAELYDLPLAGHGETVLVVDDEPTVRLLVVEALEGLGYTVIEATDSAAGLRVLQSDHPIDLLVTDVGLPGGMNGRQMADAGRVVRPGLKVLFITGYADNAVLSHGHLDPGMHLLTKPFGVEALASHLKELIAGPRENWSSTRSQLSATLAERELVLSGA